MPSSQSVVDAERPGLGVGEGAHPGQNNVSRRALGDVGGDEAKQRGGREVVGSRPGEGVRARGFARILKG